MDARLLPGASHTKLLPNLKNGSTPSALLVMRESFAMRIVQDSR
jgi:hypothetical protein